MSTVLVTGGAGYIGSHTTLCLLQSGYDVVVYDNLFNSSVNSLARVEKLTQKKISFVQGDVCDAEGLDELFSAYTIDAVVHFAAHKAVGESVQKPLVYYHNNVTGTLNLLQAMQKHQVNSFLFSSSATVYGEQNSVPYTESQTLGTPTSPYGMSKVMIESVLADSARANIGLRSVSLRYFNPVGAHESGEIGEDPQGIPNNLLPYIAQVAVGKRPHLTIFGNTYETRDGTCERDYLHVMDLAEGHVAALSWLLKKSDWSGVEAFNLGTGTPVSVFQIVAAFEQACGKPVPFEIGAPRDGDLPAFWADTTKALEVLGWRASRSLKQMMSDTWRWQANNPNGY